MSSFQYNADLGNPPPISFGSFTQRSERDMMGPVERYKFDQRPIVKKEIPADNVPQVPIGPDATTLADQLGFFGVELYGGSFLGQLAATVGDKINNFMRIMPDDPALEHFVNFSDDDSRAGRGLEGINTRSHIIKRLEDAGIPPDMWPDIVGDDPDDPKTYAEFERDLDQAILTNPEFVKGYGGSGAGLAAGIGVDAVGLFTSGELLGAPVAAAVGNAVAPAGVSVALNAVRGAVGWGASAGLQTALYQSIREGVNPYSRPDIADLLLEQGLSIGIGAGIGGLTGLVAPVLRGTVEDVPVATVVDNTAIVPAGGAAGRRGPIRVEPEPPAGLLPAPNQPKPVDYRLRLTGRYGEVAWNGMDQAPMRASTTGMLERLDDVADEAFSLHSANRTRGNNIVTDTLDAIRDAGGTTDTFLARAVARSAFLRYANGERGETLANGILDDIRGAIGDDVLGRMRAPAQPTGVSQTTTLARRRPPNTEVRSEVSDDVVNGIRPPAETTKSTFPEFSSDPNKPINTVNRATKTIETKTIEGDTATKGPRLLQVADPVTGKNASVVAYEGRVFIFVQIGDRIVPFYRSSEGTSGKVLGNWFPAAGIARGDKADPGAVSEWIIKLKEVATGRNRFYSNPEIQAAKAWLDANYGLELVAKRTGKKADDVIAQDVIKLLRDEQGLVGDDLGRVVLTKDGKKSVYETALGFVNSGALGYAPPTPVTYGPRWVWTTHITRDQAGKSAQQLHDAMLEPLTTVETSAVIALARRQSFNTDVPVLSDKLPSRGPILDLVDIVNDPAKSKGIVKHSGAATILTSIRKATGVNITVRKADEVLSDLTELVRSTAQDIRKGIRNILAKHAPGQKISVTNALVRQIQALRGGLNNQTNPSQMATATIPSVSAQPAGTGAASIPSGTLPGTASVTTTTPPSPPAPTPPPPPPVPPGPPADPRGIVRNLDAAIPFITWTQGGSSILNQSAAALRDQNPIVRMVGLLANARRILQTPGGGNVQQEFSILEEGTHNLNRYLVQMNDIMRRRRRQWRMGGDTNSRTLIERHLLNEIGQVATLQGTGKRQFHQQIIANIRSGAAFPGSTNPIEVASDEVRDWMRRLYEEAHALGIPGFRGQWNPNYFPRIWDWDALVAVSADPQNRAAMIRWAEQELATTDVGGVPARQVIWEDGTVDVYTDVPEAAVALVNALQDIATAASARTNNITKQSHVWEWEGELINALNNIAGPLRAGTAARTTSVHGRPRTVMRETTVMNLPNPVRYNVGRSNFGRGRTVNNLSMASLTSDDLPYVMRKYAISIQAAINEHRALQLFNATLDNHGMRGPGGAPIVLESLGDIAGQANRLSRDFQDIVGPALTEGRLEIVNNILDALRYRPIMDFERMGGLNKAFEEAGSFLHSAVYLSSGGGFGVTSIPEIVRSASMFGFRNFLRTAPNVAIQYARGWRNMDDPTRSMIASIQALTNPSVDRKLKQLYFAGASDEALRFGNVTRTIGNKMGSAFADLTGLGPITSLYQGVTNMMTLVHLVDVGAGRVRPLDSGTIKLLGLNQQQYDALTRWAHQNVVMQRGLVFDHPVNINNTNDPEFFQMIGFLDRSVRHNIQDVPNATDFNKVMFSGWGQLLTTFRKFSIKGIDNFMFSNLSRMRFGDIRSRIKVIRTMFAVGLVGGMLWYGRRALEHKQAIDNRDYKRAREIEEKFLNQEAFVRAAVDSMTEFWLPVTMGDTAYRALYSNENFMSNYDPNLVNINNLPQAQWLTNAASVARDVQGQAAETARDVLSIHPTFKLLEGYGLVPDLPESSRQFTIDTAKRGYRLLPGNNIPYLGDWLRQNFIIEPMRDAYYPESQYREPSAAQQRKTTEGYIR